MPTPASPAQPTLAPLAPEGWAGPRLAAARAVAEPNGRRVAAAAERLLRPQDHPGDFAIWCDAHGAGDGPPGTPA